MRHPDLELVQAEGADGLTAGYPPCEKALRVWPHHAEGEGHFLALLPAGRGGGTGCRGFQKDAHSQE